MRLFGRNANQGPTKRPDALDVPPELRPYYREQAVAARTRHVVVQVLTVALVIGLVATVGGTVWMYRHGIGRSINDAIISMTTKPSPKPKQSATTAQSNNSQNGNKSQNKTVAGNTKPSPSPAPTSTSAPSSATTNPTTGSKSSQQPAPSPTSQPASGTDTTAGKSASIPNTGPGAVVLVITVAAGIVAGVAHFIGKRRTVRL